MSDPIVVFLHSNRWCIAAAANDQEDRSKLEFSPETPVAQRVERLADQLMAVDPDVASPVILALCSQMCLVAEVDQGDLPAGKGRNEAMEYRLEERLPISAEQMAAQWIALPGSRALGICCQADVLVEIVSQLQLHQRVVQAISPAALLAGQWVAARADKTDAALVLPGPDEPAELDLLIVRAGRLEGWQWLGQDQDALAEALREAAQAGPSPVDLLKVGSRIDLPEEVASSVAQVDSTAWQEETTASAAIKMASEFAENQEPLWVNLRTHRRMPSRSSAPVDRALRIAGVMLTVLLMCLIAGGLLMSRRYEQRAEALAGRQSRLFIKTMDSRNVPLDVAARLRSERMRLAGLGGRSRAKPQKPTSALAHLQSMLSIVPRDVRFRVTQLEIDPNRIIMTGHARDLLAVEKVTNAVRQAGGYDVEPGETQRLNDRSFSFMFTARPVESPAGGRR
jgi:hypothetical protein